MTYFKSRKYKLIHIKYLLSIVCHNETSFIFFNQYLNNFTLLNSYPYSENDSVILLYFLNKRFLYQYDISSFIMQIIKAYIFIIILGYLSCFYKHAILISNNFLSLITYINGDFQAEIMHKNLLILLIYFYLSSFLSFVRGNFTSSIAV